MNLLTVTDVSKSFGGFMALEAITFGLRAGEVVSLLGPNGAGKTTLFSCLVGLSRPDKGEVVVRNAGGHVDSGLVAFLPEYPELYGSLTVMEHLRFIALLHGSRELEVRGRQLCERFGLTERLSQLPHELSQGMQRKLAIVMALMSGADLLLLDEPFNGLDPRAARELRDLVLEVARSGGAVLISTHRLAEAQTYADRFLVIDSGRLVADGDVEDLRRRAGVGPTAGIEDVYLALTGDETRHV